MKKELVVELAKVVRELQPNAMLCSRIGHGMGDYASKGDMEVPPVNIPGLWETCDTNNDSWSYAWYDTNFKSPEEILNRVVSTVAHGGTYLFNVGPNGQGQIPEVGAQFLRETGKWIQKYPQVVYAAGSSPWGHAMPWGDVTTKGKSMFLSVFDWEINVLRPGYYYLDLYYKGEGKLVWNISTDEGVVVQNLQAATEKYRNYPMGILEFKKAGKHTIKVSLVEGDPETSSLESVHIYPIN